MKRFIIIIMILILPFNSIVFGTTSTRIEFTEQEQAFIKDHPTIRLGVDPDFIPYEFIDSDDQYKGIAADYIELLSKRIGIEMKVQPDKTWSEAYELAVEKELDVLPCISKTVGRQEYFNFSDPYFSFQRVIVVQNDNTTIKKIEDLKYKTVSVQENSSHQGYLKNIPEINLSLYPTVEESLVALSRGYETAYIGNLATTAYLIKSNGITGLKYVSIDTEDPQKLHFAVRNDWPLLVSIINKGLSSITEEEKIVISDKWIGLENEIDYSSIIKTAALIGSIVFIIFIVSIYWILRLRKEIAKRILIEEKLSQAKLEAEVANKVKSNFLASMSHEIRTPLNAITGMAYLLKKNGVTLSQRMYVDKITQAAHNMLDIINDILDLAKIESGKVEIENIPFSIDTVIQRVITIVSFKIEEKGIGFSLTKDMNTPVYFIGDSKRIEQILLNLLSNAVKFTTQGEVSLAIRLIAQEGELYHLEFAVKDSGIGMSEEQIAQLFIPFTQADSSINRRFGGTGLGLSIVKSFVELMKGEICVYSTQGKGSTFITKLPLLIDATKDLEEKKKAASFYLQNIRTMALLKNDNLINLLEVYLTNFGLNTEFTKSPTNAQQLLLSVNTVEIKSFDLFIVDYDILEEKSFEYLVNIINNPQIVIKPKIIMLIPMMREDIFEKIDLYGIELGITKPIIPSVLFDGIQEMFKVKDLEEQLPIPVSANRDYKKSTHIYNVLIVEDNKTNQFIAKSILEQVGITVALANNGEEGATYYLNHASEIDLILMDLHMPILNGYDATMRIRLYDLDVPIVAMTADAITGIEEQCKRVGINHYISKPFDPDKFINKILEILDKQGDAKPKVQAAAPLIIQEEALRLLGDNFQLYQLVLKEYRQENATTCIELEQEIQNGNYEQATQIVHKAKGSSGNIGAKELYNVSIILQKALENNQNDEILKLYPEFIRLLQQSLDEIEVITAFPEIAGVI